MHIRSGCSQSAKVGGPRAARARGDCAGFGVIRNLRAGAARGGVAHSLCMDTGRLAGAGSGPGHDGSPYAGAHRLRFHERGASLARRRGGHSRARVGVAFGTSSAQPMLVGGPWTESERRP